MIILFGSQKGGCGKSTTAVNFCSELSVIYKKDVMLVDADKQSTASNWALDREEQNVPKVQCVQKYENIRETLLDLDKRYNYVVIDSAGRDSRELRTGMIAADILIIPFRPSQPDLDTLPKIADMVKQSKDLNSKLKAFALLTMVPTNHRINEHDEAVECLSEYNEIELLESFISDRKIYRDVMSNGLGVSEMNNTKAKNEFSGFVKEVLKNA